MNKKGIITVIDSWLRIKFQIHNGKYFYHKLTSEQTFLNVFDLLFALFKEVGLKYIVINSNDLSKEEFEKLPFPALIINYNNVDEVKVLGKVDLVEDIKAFKPIENCFVVIAEKSKEHSILLIDVFLGMINTWSKEILGGLFVLILLLGSFFKVFHLYEQIIFCFSLVGLFISQDLWNEQNEVQNNNSLVKKICGDGTAKSITNCKKLSNQSSKVLNYFDWSELGIFYFLGILLNFILIGLSEYSTLFQYFILYTSSIGVLFSIYSIYQQYKLKVFCKACSIIILIFYSLFASSLYFSNSPAYVSTFQYDPSVIFPIVCFCSIFLLSLFYILIVKKWNLIKQQYSYSRQRLIDYASDSTIFNRINTNKINDNDLDFLNKQSSIIYTSNSDLNTLTAFVCIHCPYCIQTLKEIYQKFLGSNLGVRIVHIPTPINYETEEEAIKQAAYMIAVLEKYGVQQYIDLFEYNQKVNGDSNLVIQEINKKYPIESSLLDDSLIAASNILKITKSYKVDSYPTLLLNNTFISNQYSLEELSLHF